MKQQCRICLQLEDVQLLLQPCRCIGSIQYVHAACLHTWLKLRFRRQYRHLSSSDTATGLLCELCRTEYRGERRGVGWIRALKIVLTSGTSVRLALNGAILAYLLYRMGTVLLETLLYAQRRKVAILLLPSISERLQEYAGLWVRVWVNISAVLLLSSALRVFTGDLAALCNQLLEECREFRISNVERRT